MTIRRTVPMLVRVLFDHPHPIQENEMSCNGLSKERPSLTTIKARVVSVLLIKVNASRKVTDSPLGRSDPIARIVNSFATAPPYVGNVDSTIILIRYTQPHTCNNTIPVKSSLLLNIRTRVPANNK